MVPTLIKSTFLTLTLSLILTSVTNAQDEEALFIKKIYDYTLGEGLCDQWLTHLSDTIGGRLTGSDNAALAVEYTQKVLADMPIVDKVWKQPCTVPKWVRGDIEEVSMSWAGSDGQHPIKATSLGNTIGTDGQLIVGKVIEVHGLDTLETMDPELLEGSVVFYNRPMSPTRLSTGHAYGEAVDQRVHGASRASRHGAKATLIRSMTTLHDDLPHTGTQSYAPGVTPIPSLAISTNDAERLSQALQSHTVLAHIRNNPQMLDSVTSHNVVAEIRGSEYPDEIILVGGHLDSWDLGGGAHDDGSGCVHALQVIQTLQDLGYKPKRTLRCVMFMNEENGLGGGLAYAKASNEKGEFHLAAIESDAGGFTPRGFACSAMPEVFKPYLANLQKFDEWLDPYDLYLKAGGGGADINPLKSQGGLLIGFRPDNSRYFDLHHTAADVMANVNVRELRMGAAAITALVYLIDQRGL